MSQKRAGTKNRCPNCKINHNVCVCEFIIPRTTSTLISLVVHVSELKLSSNTAQFVQKLLPEQTEIVIRGRMNEKFTSEDILARPGRALFLYPTEDALELNDDFKAKYPGPYHLIVPDGNWNQARQVKKREPGFKDLPAVKLPPGIISEYQLRKANHPEWVCTFEATAHALAILDGISVRDHMMRFFRKWVSQTLKVRSGDFRSEEN